MGELLPHRPMRPGETMFGGGSGILTPFRRTSTTSSAGKSPEPPSVPAPESNETDDSMRSAASTLEAALTRKLAEVNDPQSLEPASITPESPDKT